MKDNKKIIYALLIAIIAICGVIFMVFESKKDIETININNDPVQLESQVNDKECDDLDIIYVQVSGAINNEGVYSLNEGARVFEVVELAGGLKSDADLSVVNRSRILKDEDNIYFPTIEEVESGKYSKEGIDLLININQASKEQLMKLPGIGDAKAQSIINYRERNSGFKSIEDIKKVEGIKDAMYENIKDLITI